MDDRLYNLLNKLIEKNNIYLDKSELKLQILSHPSYPSLHAVTGVLDYFNIDNLALKVPTDLETLKQLPIAFMALVKSEDTKEFAIVSQKDKRILLEFSSGQKKKLPTKEFLEIWNGIIVAVEKNEKTKTREKVELKKTTYLLGILLGIFITGHFFYLQPTPYQSFHFLLSITGIALSYLIVQHEFGFQSKVVHQFCSASESTSCEAVLNSKGAKIFKQIKLSDLSLIYFVGLLISSYLLAKEATTYSPLLYLSLFSLPITFYSIYYQYSVVKKWCTLCLSTVAILWLQALGILVADTPLILTEGVNSVSILITTFSFSVVTFSWLFIRPLLTDRKNFEELSIRHNAFKRNYDLFFAIFNNGESTPDKKIENEIILGNRNSPFIITTITNPFCVHCKAVHTLVEDILNKYSDLVQVRIRFNLKIENLESEGIKVATKLLELYHTESKELCLEAMHSIYGGESLESWFQRWGACTDQQVFISVLNEERTWCAENKINFTPEILINGKSFPKEYDKTDLIYFIEDLHEEQNKVSLENTSLKFDRSA